LYWRIGGWTIQGYSLFLWLGALVGLGWTAWRLRPRAVRDLDRLLLLVTVGVVGARAAHVWANWAYFREHLSEAVRPDATGLSFHGGILGGMIALAWWAWRRGAVDALRLGDLLAPPLALACAFGWAGAWVSGVAYGLPGDPMRNSLLVYRPDIFGQVAWRWPTQAFGVALSLIVLGALLALRGRVPRPGGMLGVYFVLYGLGDWGIQFLRGDETVVWWGWRIAQWADLLLMLIGFSLILWGARARRVG